MLALAAGSVMILAGPASAFDGWCFCPPPCYYYPPPVVYYFPACPPSMPAVRQIDRIPPKVMPGATAPNPQKKEEKPKTEVTPAGFKEGPTSATVPGPLSKPAVEHATPTPAPPPDADKKSATPTRPLPPTVKLEIPTVTPATGAEKKTETTPSPTPKNIDLTVPKIGVEPPKEESRAVTPNLTVPDLGKSEPGKIPPLHIPAATPEKVDAAVVPSIPRPMTPAKGLQIPPIDLPPPTAAPAPTPKKKSTSGSSPLVNAPVEWAISVEAVAGSPPASGLYTVRFINRTKSAFTLTVESGSITLPAMYFVDVTIGRSFTWKAGDEPSRKAEIPGDTAGLVITVKP
jgi:hypothetical protein